jgi:hypothetical protein
VPFWQNDASVRYDGACMANKKMRFIIIGTCGAIVLIFVLKNFLFSSAFAGEKFYDFGFVDVIPPKTVVEHTFSLTNTSGRDLVLVDVVPDCGCMTTEAYQELIKDGDEFMLPVQLKLRQSQMRRSTIRLVFEDGTIEILTLRAEGRLKDPLRVSPFPIVVKKEGQVSLAMLGIEQFDESQPPVPEFTIPNWLTLSNVKWKLKSKYKPREKIPANWAMQLEFSKHGSFVEGKDLTITVGKKVLSVPIVDYVDAPEDIPFSKIPVQ